MVTNFGLNSAIVLAQLNLGANSASLLGIFLAVAGVGLYFMRSIRPELSRDHDIFFSAVGLLCGLILLTQGWRLDPILQFSQYLLAGSAIFFGFETVRLRGIATEQAKRNTPIVDDERPVSRVYRTQAEVEDYEELDSMEERYNNRRLRGSDDYRDRRTDRYEGEVRSPRSRGSSQEYGSGERPRRRPSRSSRRSSEPLVDSWNASLDSDWEEQPPRSRPSRRSPEPPVDSWNTSLDNDWEEQPPRSRPSRRSPEPPVDNWEASLGSDWEDEPPRSRRPRSQPPESTSPEAFSSPRRRRPSTERGTSQTSGDEQVNIGKIPLDDYVDFQPIDSSEEENKNSGDYDY
ncbi:MAG: hypothetical protein F6K31_36515 [Symploca sp. SIO2G7]|nr:hypothetical protein [Symploca sp. SIO2G7]